MYWLVLDGGLSFWAFSLTALEVTLGLDPESELNEESTPELDDDVDAFGVAGLMPSVALNVGVAGEAMKRPCVAFE